MNSAILKNSDRLQRLLEFISDGEWHSTREINRGANIEAVSAACAELRDNGIPVICRRRKGIKDVWEYSMGGAHG